MKRSIDAATPKAVKSAGSQAFGHSNPSGDWRESQLRQKAPSRRGGAWSKDTTQGKG